MIHIGFFPQFKGLDTVLIDADAEGLSAFRAALRRLRAGATINITAEPDVINHGGIVVVAESSPLKGLVTERMPGHFKWIGTAEDWEDADAKVAALRNRRGHQYLTEGGIVQIVVSAGEYGSEWWERQSTPK